MADGNRHDADAAAQARREAQIIAENLRRIERSLPLTALPATNWPGAKRTAGNPTVGKPTIEPQRVDGAEPIAGVRAEQANAKPAAQELPRRDD